MATQSEERENEAVNTGPTMARNAATANQSPCQAEGAPAIPGFNVQDRDINVSGTVGVVELC